MKHGPYLRRSFDNLVWWDLILSVLMNLITAFCAYRITIDFHIVFGFIALCWGVFIKVGLKVASLDWHLSLRASKVKRIRKTEKRQSYISIDNLPLSPYRIALDNPLFVTFVFSATHIPLLLISYFFPVRHFFWIFYIGLTYVLYVFYNTPPTRIHIKTPLYRRKWLFLRQPHPIVLFWWQVSILKVLWWILLLCSLSTFYTYLLTTGFIISNFTPLQFLLVSHIFLHMLKFFLGYKISYNLWKEARSPFNFVSY